MHDIVSKFAEEIVAVGSRVTCNPAPTDTDQDYLVLVKKRVETGDVLDTMHSYAMDTSEAYDAYATLDDEDGFVSFKKGDVNYIITRSTSFFNSFLLASRVAKELNVLVKEDRIKLFQTILYRNEDFEDFPNIMEKNG